MYFLDCTKVPIGNKFDVVDACCLAITNNMAVTKREMYTFFKESPLQLQEQFKNTFRRQIGFQINAEFKAKHCSCDGNTAQMYFRLLNEVWKDLYLASLTGNPCNLLIHGETAYATNNHYLPSEVDKVTNDDLFRFSRKCLKTAVFVGNTYGIKNVYRSRPSGVCDICAEGEVTEFVLKATQTISSTLHQNFNRRAFPGYIVNDSFFRHDECPVVYGIDVGHEISPINENCSLVPNGFGCRKYLQDALDVSVLSMERSLAEYTPTGKCKFVFLS
jgi:hypothetical protein